MSDDEDLFENPFFQDLKKRFTSVYQDIELSKHVLLVPGHDSLIGLDIDKTLIGMTIFYAFLTVSEENNLFLALQLRKKR